MSQHVRTVVSLLSLSPAAARTFLRHPQLQHDNVIPKVMFLLSDVGLSKERVREMVLRHPKMFNSVMLDDLVPTVEYLKGEVGMTDVELKRMIKKHPRVVRYNRVTIKRNISFFRTSVLGGLGTKKERTRNLKRIYLQAPRLLGYDPKGLGVKVEYFKDMGLRDEELRELFVSCPSILTYSTENNIEATREWLELQGLGEDKVCRCLVKYPNLFTLSVTQNLDPKVEWMEGRIGLERERGHVARVVSMFPPIMWLSKNNLDSKLTYLQETFGWDDDELRGVILGMPQILGLGLEGNIKETVEYYLSQGCSKGQLGEAIMDSPSLLAYSLEGRIKPRVEEMEGRGIKVRYAPLYVVGMPEKGWRKWIDGQGGTWSVSGVGV
ncbi:hypothetical protein TrRE_jg2783 [Triparma retinervis]|uniref:Uncharacterized protein n=1 Tax=Triparma retinervis TaxID=2557542 RepID=A0A9W7AJP9_9STRA|nr:hypothetical protein TrRE_jg2783 [Triparma retinervis]